MVVLNRDEQAIMNCLVNRVDKVTFAPNGMDAQQIVAETHLSMAEINRACESLELKGYVSVATTDEGNVDAIHPIPPIGYNYLAIAITGHK